MDRLSELWPHYGDSDDNVFTGDELVDLVGHQSSRVHVVLAEVANNAALVLEF